MSLQLPTIAHGEFNWRTLGLRWQAQTLRFFQWWAGELRALVPPRLRRMLDGGHGQLIVEPYGDLLRVALRENSDTRVIALVELEPRGTSDLPLSRSDLAAAAGAAADIVVCLPADWLIERVVVLPAETEERLQDVLRFELDRLTPFRPDDVCFDHAILSRDAANRTIEVLLMVIQRDRLEGLLARLDACAIRPSRVVPATLPPHVNVEAINLLPADRRSPAQSRGAMLDKILGALAVLLFAATLAAPIMYYRRSAAELEAALAEVRGPAQEALRIQRQVNRLQADAAFFAQRRITQPAFVDVLRELTLLLPDDTWISRLELSDGRITLQGESASASALIGIVEGSPRFRETAFAASVTRSPSADRDLFSLRARVEPGEAAK